MLRGIEAAHRVGFAPLKINTVLVGGFNDDEIPELVELTRKYPIEVRFIELMPLGPRADFPEGVLPAVLCGAGTGAGASAAGAQLRCSPAVCPARCEGGAGLISPISHDFCAQCDRIRLTSDGKLKPCLHSDKEIYLRGLHGTMLEQSLVDAIRAKPQSHQELVPGHVSAGGRPMNRIEGSMEDFYTL